ncbi:MAG: ParB/RepB/Spo0J family partition protein, partial [Bdellovibrionales bacterium]|nr:ParB/RepB/Spo0J family partition protein [Bdellovibrionales bacterium]
KLKELAASIKAKGVLQPITVRKVGLVFEIIAGERRWRASQQAGLHEVPAIVRSATDQDSLELALIENIQRHELNPIEEARAYQELQQKFRLTHDQISEKVGKERATITNTMRLLGLPSTVQSMVADGRLTSGHAKVLLGMSSQTDMERLANDILKKKLSVRKLELEIKRLAQPRTSLRGSDSDSEEDKIMLQLIQDLEEDLQKRIGTKVKINYQNHQGSIDISFYSDDQLTELAERIKDSWKATKSH